MRRYAQTALLVLVGGMLLKLVVTGAYLRYVRGVHAPLLVVAGVVLLGVAAVSLWRDLRAEAASRDDDTIATGLRLDGLFGSDRARGARASGEIRQPAPFLPVDDEGTGDHRARALAAGRAAAAHEGLDGSTGRVERPDQSELARMAAPTAIFDMVPSGRPRTVEGDPPDSSAARTEIEDSRLPAGPAGREPVRSARAGWALLAGALAVLVLAPPALGSFPASRGGTLVVGGIDAALAPGDPVPMSLVDYAAHAAAGGQALAGRQVRLVGFVLAGPRGEPYLVRLVTGCCAAGARPVKVGLTGDLPDGLSADRWVEVVGAYTDYTERDPANAAPIPFVSVISVTEIDPPMDPYE